MGKRVRVGGRETKKKTERERKLTKNHLSIKLKIKYSVEHTATHIIFHLTRIKYDFVIGFSVLRTVKPHVFLMNAFSSYVCPSFFLFLFLREIQSIHVLRMSFLRLTPLITCPDELHVSTFALVNDMKHAHSLHQINYSCKFLLVIYMILYSCLPERLFQQCGGDLKRELTVYLYNVRKKLFLFDSIIIFYSLTILNVICKRS